MLWWQWLLIFSVPVSGVVIAGMLLGKFLSLNRKKTPTKWHPWSFPTWEKRHGYNCITFDQFLDMYSINPNKWCTQIEASYTSDGVWDKAVYRMPDYLNDISLFWATLRDKRRYKKWWLEQRKAYNHRIKVAEYKVVLEDVQKDVQIKMDAIQKEHEAELKRIEEERKKNQDEYERLMNEVINLARSATIPVSKLANSFSQIVPGTISYPPMPKIEYKTEINANGDRYITQYAAITPQPNKVYIDYAHKYYLKDNNYRLMYQGQVCEYFEADCGTPYIRTPDGKILEVIFEE